MWRPRIHLNTAVVLMIVAGILLNANLRNPRVSRAVYETRRRTLSIAPGRTVRTFDFAGHEILTSYPAVFKDDDYQVCLEPERIFYGWPLDAATGYFRTMETGEREWHGKYFNKMIACNAAIALAILLAAALACELLPSRLTRLFKRG